MSTNPSASAPSPGPRMPGPPAAEPAGPWESQHLCRGSAGGAGGGGRPPGPPRARPPRPSPRSFTERSEWNEWVPASSDARGNQMTRREGLLPSGRRLFPPAKGTQCASGWTGPTPPPAPAAGLARPAAKGLDPGGAIPLGGGWRVRVVPVTPVA